MGQDLSSYLDGLYYSNVLTYWDYIHLDTLLSLQNPKTDLPDEKIFIGYHQITELYFQLCINELNQLCIDETLDPSFFLTRLTRLTRYFEHLCSSFDVMADGMEREQFLKFRMSLLPASGFQSAQYRMIEIMSAPFQRLIIADKRKQFDRDTPIAHQFEYMYWRYGATELETGKRTLTLKVFEEKYRNQFIKLAEEHRHTNLYRKYREIVALAPENLDEIKEAMRHYDALVNVNWPLSHLKSAVKYLERKPETIAATGGTNWQKYLPPRMQQRIFYPELWQEDELKQWGIPFVKGLMAHLPGGAAEGAKRPLK